MDFESIILSVVRSKEDGIPESEAQKLACQSISLSEWTNGLQSLITSNIIIRESDGEDSIIRAPKTDYAELHLNGHQLMVYRVVDMVGSKGITEDDIVKKVHGKNFQLKKDIKKALKSLFEADHVQKVRSIQNRKEVMYLVKGIKPIESIAGGRWYTHDKGFDTAFVQELRSSCVECFQRLKQTEFGVAFVHKWIMKNSNCSRVPSIDDVSEILFTLELDEIIQAVKWGVQPVVECHSRIAAGPPRPSLNATYKLARKNGSLPFFESPCTSCQYLRDCDPDGHGMISPLTANGSVCCPYLQEWLCLD
ncbi:hypothetical protein XU18_2950 [Perkinsela sp. CCAP 1560/4]|nr:hypothetical protein XU18_2950 [Perkinsela sp. CCAP 1560/4]|eukprot:KNH06194.1 hypothetical protein XU18_2950 [Perkinsela sp. CCAP 1560/4]